MSSAGQMNRECADIVMLIDDNEIDLFINQKVIELCRFTRRIITYHSGREALEYLLSATEADIPDLIFLDLNMPLIDGFRFLYEFSTFPDHVRNKASVIVLTSSDNMRDKEKIEVNADVIKFLSKPLNDQKLEQIRVLLENQPST
ncbi:response regulator [Fulvivirga ulvae]|uniref:response regulator n=1 Tax=Fulvivirga ulvae TaxID=2904245 RepID=UPI001F3180D2|nr:response regulator [Fulvivirga ulvae]UII30100.1 response regulator [Fulvivirga ulvae]